MKTMTDEEWAALGSLTDSKTVSKFLGISWRQAQRLAKEGQIPAVKVGKLWRFPTAKIRAMVDGEAS